MTINPPVSPRQSAAFLAAMVALALAGVLSLALAPLGALAPEGTNPDLVNFR